MSGSLQVKDSGIVEPVWVRGGLMGMDGGWGGGDEAVDCRRVDGGAVLDGGTVNWWLRHDGGGGGDGADLTSRRRLVLRVGVDSGPQVAQTLPVKTLHSDHLIADAGTSAPQHLDTVAVLLQVGVKAIQESIGAELLAGSGAILLEEFMAEVVPVLVGLE